MAGNGCTCWGTALEDGLVQHGATEPGSLWEQNLECQVHPIDDYDPSVIKVAAGGTRTVKPLFEPQMDNSAIEELARIREHSAVVWAEGVAAAFQSMIIRKSVAEVLASNPYKRDE